MSRYVKLGALLVLVVLLAWAAAQIGGIGIRRVKPLGEKVRLLISNPAMPGVDVTVRWNVPTQELDRDVVFLMRTTEATVLVGSGKLLAGNAHIRFFCDFGGQTVGLIMSDAAAGQLFASTDVELLPDGPDCLR